MDDTAYDDGTLSSAVSRDGDTVLSADAGKPSQEDRKEPVPSEGGEDEGSSAVDGNDDHLKEDQKPLPR